MEKNPIGDGTALAILIFAVCAGGLMWAMPTGVLDWAAWAGMLQALGTVVAIWWTYKTTRDQFEAERQERDTERKESKRLRETEAARVLEAQMESIRAIVIDSLEALLEFQNYVAKLPAANQFEKSPARLQDAQYALRSLLARDLPPGLAVHIVELQQPVSRCLHDNQNWYLRWPEVDAVQTWYRCALAFKCAAKLEGVCKAWQYRQESAIFRAQFVHPETLEEIDPMDFQALESL